MTSGLTIITCTGDRPEALTLCARYVARQTWQGPLQWIVVDDGAEPSPLPKAADNVSRTHIRRAPSWRHGGNTLALNLLAALPEVQYDRVLFVEDDDAYAPDYCAVMANLLDVTGIAGDPISLYYHVPSQRYRIMENLGHASLSQTGIRAELLPLLRQICRESPDFIDARLWARSRCPRVLRRIGKVVGIKGLPGRAGIGVGHRPDERPTEWTDDPQGAVLREWIGREDSQLYERFTLYHVTR